LFYLLLCVVVDTTNKQHSNRSN